MFEFFCLYFVFVVIGLVPDMLADFDITDWQWWACVVPLWIGVWLREWTVTN